MKKTLTIGLLFFLVKATAFGQSLSLPFFDDFARYDNRLDPNKWEAGGGTYVNNVFSGNPITKNIVTFNSFLPDGKINPSMVRTYGVVDTLTSKPINLGGLGGADSVYLSFYLQTGGLGDIPQSSSGKPVFFQILFKDNTGTWSQARRIDAPNSLNRTTNFQFYRIAVTEAKYFHGNFQFQLRSLGNNLLSDDTWNLDYVQLAANRRVTDQIIDVATSRRVQPILKRYTALPIHQFNANVAGELTDSLYTTLNNLDNNFRNIPNFTAVQIGSGPGIISMPQTLAVPPLARQFKTSVNQPQANNFNGLSGFQDIKATVFITSPGETNAETQFNDTISRITHLHNYYAFDDGSVEDLISVLPGVGTGQIAHKFLLNQDDMVSAISVYLPHAGNNPGTQVNFRIWKIDAAGNPDQNGLLQQIPFTVPALSQLNDWVTIPVNPPVPVKGGFFLGWSNARTLTFSVGLDKNEKRNGTIYFTANNAWNTFTNNPGAIMLRAVMNNNITGVKSEVAQNLEPQINVYPNPASGYVTLAGAFETVTLRSATGQVIKEVAGQGGETKLDLNGLATGFYLLQFKTKTGNITRKLIVNPNR